MIRPDGAVGPVDGLGRVGVEGARIEVEPVGELVGIRVEEALDDGADGGVGCGWGASGGEGHQHVAVDHASDVSLESGEGEIAEALHFGGRAEAGVVAVRGLDAADLKERPGVEDAVLEVFEKLGVPRRDAGGQAGDQQRFRRSLAVLGGEVAAFEGVEFADHGPSADSHVRFFDGVVVDGPDGDVFVAGGSGGEACTGSGCRDGRGFRRRRTGIDRKAYRAQSQQQEEVSVKLQTPVYPVRARPERYAGLDGSLWFCAGGADCATFFRMRIVVIALLAAVLVFGADSYNGKWTSDASGNGGEIRLTLKPEAKAVFTLSGQDVPCTNVTSKTEGESIVMAYDFILQGYKLRSTLKGTVKEGKFSGKYNTATVEDGAAVDAGTFDTSSQ